MDQDETWHICRPWPWPYCVRWGPSSPPQFSAHVYCGQTAGWIKISLGVEVCLGPSHIVLDGDPSPPPGRGHSPPVFGPCLLWPNSFMDQGVTWYEGRPRPRPHCVTWGPSSPVKGAGPPVPPPRNFQPMSIVAKRSPISATAEHFLYNVPNRHV